MANQERNGFETIFLAGVGALVLTGEKLKELVEDLAARGEISAAQGKEVLDRLVARGEITAAQGKAIGEELGRSVKKAFYCVKSEAQDILERVEEMDDEALAKLRARIDELESAKKAQAQEQAQEE